MRSEAEQKGSTMENNNQTGNNQLSEEATLKIVMEAFALVRDIAHIIRECFMANNEIKQGQLQLQKDMLALRQSNAILRVAPKQRKEA